MWWIQFHRLIWLEIHLDFEVNDVDDRIRQQCRHQPPIHDHYRPWPCADDVQSLTPYNRQTFHVLSFAEIYRWYYPESKPKRKNVLSNRKNRQMKKKPFELNLHSVRLPHLKLRSYFCVEWPEPNKQDYVVRRWNSMHCRALDNPNHLARLWRPLSNRPIERKQLQLSFIQFQWLNCCFCVCINDPTDLIECSPKFVVALLPEWIQIFTHCTRK